MSTMTRPPAVPGDRKGPSPSADQTPATSSTSARLAVAEEQVLDRVRQISPTVLRVAVATIFVWFGALKVAGVQTMTAGLISAALPFVDPDLSVPAIGAFEVVLGLAIVAGRRLPVILAVTAGHLAATFMVLVVAPEVAFRDGNPLMLTVEGEFVLKNLVLLASVVALLGLTSSRTFRSPRGR